MRDLDVREIFKEKRLEKKLTEKELSEISKISVVQISNLENKKCKPRPSTIKKLCESLGCDFEIIHKQMYK